MPRQYKQIHFVLGQISHMNLFDGIIPVTTINFCMIYHLDGYDESKPITI